VFDQIAEGSIREIRQAGFRRLCKAAALFQITQHIVNGKMSMHAGIVQRFSPAAAVIDAKLLKGSGCIGNFYG
jgi:hypothetical protein